MSNKRTLFRSPRRNQTVLALALIAIAAGTAIGIPVWKQARFNYHKELMLERMQYVAFLMSSHASTHKNHNQYPRHISQVLGPEKAKPKHLFNPNLSGYPLTVSYDGAEPDGPYIYADYCWVYIRELGNDTPASYLLAFSRAHPDGTRCVLFPDKKKHGYAHNVGPYDFDQIIKEQNLWRAQQGHPLIDPNALGDFIAPEPKPNPSLDTSGKL